jgi:DNA-binding GntR family transcriptional regulator
VSKESVVTERTERTPFDRVYRGILRALYEGRYAPGQRLVAPDLMRAFDVGRGTVREVLQRLASTGVVRITPHKGAEVRRLSRREVSDVLDLVEVLVGLAARGAAKAAISDPQVRKELKARYEALLQPDADFGGFLSARENYYRYLVSSSQNRELQRVFPNVQVQIMRVQLRTFNRAADSADPSDYADLTAAVLSGDPERAEQAGRVHVQKTMGRVHDLPDRAFEPEPASA